MSGPRGSRFGGRPGRRLTVWTGFHDRSRHTSLEHELLRRARQAGVAGATVFEALDGYGASGRRHRAHLLSDDAPLALVVVDEPERVERFLDDVGPLLQGMVLALEDVEILEL